MPKCFINNYVRKNDYSLSLNAETHNISSSLDFDSPCNLLLKALSRTFGQGCTILRMQLCRINGLKLITLKITLISFNFTASRRPRYRCANVRHVCTVNFIAETRYIVQLYLTRLIPELLYGSGSRLLAHVTCNALNISIKSCIVLAFEVARSSQINRAFKHECVHAFLLNTIRLSRWRNNILLCGFVADET